MISRWQFTLLINNFLLGTTLFVSIQALIQQTQQHAWIIPLWNGCLGLIVSVLWILLMRAHPGKTLAQILQEVWSRPVGTAIALLYFFHFSSIAGWVLHNMSDFMNGTIMRDTPKSVFHIMFLIVACYTVAQGAEGVARLNQLVTPFLFLPFWFVLLLATMMLPGQVTMIPMFVLFKELGWINTYLPLTVPYFFGGAFYIFLLRQFFLTIPRELSEAAKIDGCSEFFIYARIFLPLSKPALATLAIFTFMGTWNDFLGPLIYLNDKDLFTLALGLRSFQMQHGTRWNVMMAASIIVMMPTIILFFTCQRYFIEGITLTGIKG